MKPYRPEKIFVEDAVRDSAVTRNSLRALPDTPVQPIDSLSDLLRENRSSLSRRRAKKFLVLAEQKGPFFKACPGGRGRLGIQNICCNYSVINLGSNCDMDCSYCFLQSYLTNPYLIVYANSDALFAELDRAFSANPAHFYRVGTGELADSLSLDSVTGYGRLLVEFFSSRTNAVLELKTKTDQVHGLLGLDHRGRTVLAWSLNPRSIQRTDEHRTATIDQRFRAAARCVAAGYKVAFHFDPIVEYPGWKRDYAGLVAELFDTVPARSVAWISLGGLRMTRELKEIMRIRFPKSVLPLGELVPGEDGKLRYLKSLRVEIYSRMASWINEAGNGLVPVYLCMEKPDVWLKVFGQPAPSAEALQQTICGYPKFGRQAGFGSTNRPHD